MPTFVFDFIILTDTAFNRFSPSISASLLKIEKATAVNEVMMAASVSVAHSAPDQSSQTDEGFVEPKHHFFKKKVTYEVSSIVESPSEGN